MLNAIQNQDQQSTDTKYFGMKDDFDINSDNEEFLWLLLGSASFKGCFATLFLTDNITRQWIIASKCNQAHLSTFTTITNLQNEKTMHLNN